MWFSLAGGSHVWDVVLLTMYTLLVEPVSLAGLYEHSYNSGPLTGVILTLYVAVRLLLLFLYQFTRVGGELSVIRIVKLASVLLSVKK